MTRTLGCQLHRICIVPSSSLSRFLFCLHFPYRGREERGNEPRTCREAGENLYIPLSPVKIPRPRFRVVLPLWGWGSPRTGGVEDRWCRFIFSYALRQFVPQDGGVTAPHAGRGRPGWPMAAHQLASLHFWRSPVGAGSTQRPRPLGASSGPILGNRPRRVHPGHAPYPDTPHSRAYGFLVNRRSMRGFRRSWTTS